LPGGPVGPPARWAATSNVGQTTYPVSREKGMGREGKEGSEGQSHKKEDRDGLERRRDRDP